MKPIVLIINNADNGKITLTQDELKKYIADAYEQGYTDGQKNSWTYSGLNTITNPNVTWTSPTIKNPNYNLYDITCAETARTIENK